MISNVHEPHVHEVIAALCRYRECHLWTRHTQSKAIYEHMAVDMSASSADEAADLVQHWLQQLQCLAPAADAGLME